MTQPGSYTSIPKVFISSLLVLVLAACVFSTPVKPPLQSSIVRANFALLKVVNTVKWYSRTNKFLLIDMDATVKTTTNCSLPAVTMEMYSIGLAGVKLIKGVASGRYLAMNKYGKIYSTAKASEETLFFETIDSHNYSTFASFKYYSQVAYDVFVEVKKNGKVQSLNNSQPNSVEFLPMPATVKIC